MSLKKNENTCASSVVITRHVAITLVIVYKQFAKMMHASIWQHSRDIHVHMQQPFIP